jgi:tetratricopeptide (TPR) repeat protein
LTLLDGLPLAIAQAGAYLHQSGVGIQKYVEFYDQQWAQLMRSRHQVQAPLQDYPDRSIWTTWTISYKAVRDQDELAANLLLLWSFLDNKDLWYGLFTEAVSASTIVAAEVSRWLGDLGNNEVEFAQAMKLLRSYSLAEVAEGGSSYDIHPVVHKWVYHYGGQDFWKRLARLAMLVVGWAVPDSSRQDYSKLQRRLLPHAQACLRRMVDEMADEVEGGDDVDGEAGGGGKVESKVELDAIHLLGQLCKTQGKLGEAEKMYMRALQGYEEALGPKHTSTLDTVNNLGLLYANQGKLGEAEKMYMRALQGYEETPGPNRASMLNTVNNLGLLYMNQGKLGEAEEMLMQALQGFEEVLGLEHTSTLSTSNNLGLLYSNQGKLGKAQKMFMRALQGFEETLGPKHTSTLDTVNNLGSFYVSQGKLGEAEEMFMRALQGYEEALGPETVEKHIPALNTVWNLGFLFRAQKKLIQARQMLQRALAGFNVVLGTSCAQSQHLERALESLDAIESKPRTLVGRIKRRIFNSH